LVKDQDQGGWLSSKTPQHQRCGIDSRPVFPLPDSPRAVLKFRQPAVHCLTLHCCPECRGISFMTLKLDEALRELLPTLVESGLVVDDDWSRTDAKKTIPTAGDGGLQQGATRQTNSNAKNYLLRISLTESFRLVTTVRMRNDQQRCLRHPPPSLSAACSEGISADAGGVATKIFDGHGEVLWPGRGDLELRASGGMQHGQVLRVQGGGRDERALGLAGLQGVFVL